MNAIQPYLNFDGNTREAMTFYQKCLGGELTFQTFGEAHAPVPGAEDRIIHARITNGTSILMASDTMPGMPFTQGNNVHVTIQCDSLEEIERLFVTLGEGGKVTMPLGDMFWGARFGMFLDKFGIYWMLNYELPKKG